MMVEDLVVTFEDLVVTFDDLVVTFEDLVVTFDDLVVTLDDLVVTFEDKVVILFPMSPSFLVVLLLRYHTEDSEDLTPDNFKLVV